MDGCATLVDVLFSAAMRAGAIWHHLIRDLGMLEVRDECDDILGPFAVLLKSMAARLTPDIRRGHFLAGARPDVRDTFVLLAALGGSTSPSPTSSAPTIKPAIPVPPVRPDRTQVDPLMADDPWLRPHLGMKSKGKHKVSPAVKRNSPDSMRKQASEDLKATVASDMGEMSAQSSISVLPSASASASAHALKISEGGGADPLLPAPTGETWSKNRTAHGSTQDASCGPELGTLDEVDLLPPLLANAFVVGQRVKVVQSLTVGQDRVPLKVGAKGRVLRQHETEHDLLWMYFDSECGMVSVRADLLEP